MTRTGLCGSLLFGATLALATGCGPPVASSPTFAADVRPIFLSHCVRCHGGGGTLNETRVPSGPDAALLPATESAPANGYLGQFSDSGDCTPVGGVLPTTCHRGARYEAGTNPNSGNLHLYLHTLSSSLAMPPPPAPLLNDWELKVVDAWVANPICDTPDHSDPAICSADAGQ
jgi:hypothetical protein